MMRGSWITQAIFVAAKIGIADQIDDEAQSCEELSTRTGVPASSLYRLLRALASIGIFAEVAGRRFEMTPLAACLRSDAPGSLRATSIVMGELYYPAWSSLLPSIQTGHSAFSEVFGTDFFGHFAENAEIGARFQESMANQNRRTNLAIPQDYDFHGFHRIVDIGGGNGSLLAAILQANPGAHGVLFDLPHVLEDGRNYLTEAGLIDRCELVSGSFFNRVPSAGDVYLLRWILHDFDDEAAMQILGACRVAMSPGARLLAVEQIVGEEDDASSWFTKFMDLHMLVLLNGRERTSEEFRELFAASGFQLSRIIPTAPQFSILETFPMPAGA